MKNTINQLNVASKASNLLGECPVWSEERQSLFWIDIEADILHEITWPEKRVHTWKMPESIGMLALQDSNHLILALENGLVHFNLTTGELKWFLDIEREIKINRSNDGKCDTKGRLWLGTINWNCIDPTGSLYMIDKNLRLTKKWITLPFRMA